MLLLLLLLIMDRTVTHQAMKRGDIVSLPTLEGLMGQKDSESDFDMPVCQLTHSLPWGASTKLSSTAIQLSLFGIETGQYAAFHKASGPDPSVRGAKTCTKAGGWFSPIFRLPTNKGIPRAPLL